MITDVTDVASSNELMVKLQEANDLSCSVRLSPQTSPADSDVFKAACEIIATCRRSISLTLVDVSNA